VASFLSRVASATSIYYIYDGHTIYVGGDTLINYTSPEGATVPPVCKLFVGDHYAFAADGMTLFYFRPPSRNPQGNLVEEPNGFFAFDVRYALSYKKTPDEVTYGIEKAIFETLTTQWSLLTDKFRKPQRGVDPQKQIPTIDYYRPIEGFLFYFDGNDAVVRKFVVVPRAQRPPKGNEILWQKPEDEEIYDKYIYPNYQDGLAWDYKPPAGPHHPVKIPINKIQYLDNAYHDAATELPEPTAVEIAKDPIGILSKYLEKESEDHGDFVGKPFTFMHVSKDSVGWEADYDVCQKNGPLPIYPQKPAAITEPPSKSIPTSDSKTK
jgi:hypothetical protein